MTATRDTAPGMDFWAALGVGQENEDETDAPRGGEDKLVATTPPEPDPPAAPPPAQQEWTSLLSDDFGAQPPAPENYGWYETPTTRPPAEPEPEAAEVEGGGSAEVPVLDEDRGAAVTRVEPLPAFQDVPAPDGGAAVVGRPSEAASPVGLGVLSKELTARVERALTGMQAVVVTGPAAPVVVRALATLIPADSRVFEGPYGTLPAGCVAVDSPLDADYVIGVRPGPVAEAMAAAGQIGALIANPESELAAALHLVVTGRAAAIEQVTAR